MMDCWWHRRCWIEGAPAREEALRSTREAVGRHRALAEYLLAQDEWGGLPALIVRGNLVASAFDNRGSRQHIGGEACDNLASNSALVRCVGDSGKRAHPVDLAWRVHRLLNEDGSAAVI